MKSDETPMPAHLLESTMFVDPKQKPNVLGTSAVKDLKVAKAR